MTKDYNPTKDAVENDVDEEIDLNLKQTFPASDPPSWTLGHDHEAKKAEDDRLDGE